MDHYHKHLYSFGDFVEAIDLGWLFHYEYETDQRGLVTSNQWHAADPEWVRHYHEAGGTWGYTDSVKIEGDVLLGGVDMVTEWTPFGWVHRR